MISGYAVGSCTMNIWPPAKSRSWAPGIRAAMAAPLAGGATPSYVPDATSVGQATRGSRS